MLVCPVSATASQGVEIVDNSVQGVSIVYSSSILRVTGAEADSLDRPLVISEDNQRP